MMKKHRKLLTLGLVLVPVAVVAAGIFAYINLPKSSAVQFEGNVEISTSPCFSTVSGTVKELLVTTGESIQAGQVLAVLDDAGIENELEQLRATLAIKQAKVNQLSKPAQTQGLEAARKAAQESVGVYQEQLTAAQRALEQAQNQLEIHKQLYQAGAIAKVELEQLEQAVQDCQSAVAIADAQLSAAKSNVDTFQTPQTSEDELQAAQADLQLTQLQIEKLEKSRKDYQIKALQDGVVVSKSVDLGSTVLAGQSVFELSNGSDKYFVFYLPEENIKAYAYGDTLELYRFNSSQVIGTATINYMDWKAVYTPKDFETSANKNKKSVKIKALIHSQQDIGVGETLVTKLLSED